MNIQQFAFNPPDGYRDTNAIPTDWTPEAVVRELLQRFLDQAKEYINTSMLPMLKALVGAILPYGGTAAPSGTLLCDGSAVSRTTYASLFAAIGTTWGAGDGSTTFNLPDLRGVVLEGLDATQPEFNAMAKKSGVKTKSFNLSSNGYAKIAVTSANSIESLRVSTDSYTANIKGDTTLHTSTDATSYGAALGGTTDSGSILPPYAVINYIIIC